MEDRRSFWRHHLETIEAEGVTTKAYAEREGLSVASLYMWRSELRREPQVPAANASRVSRFVAIEVEQQARPEARPALHLGRSVTLEMASLPEPAWLAALVQSMERH